MPVRNARKTFADIMSEIRNTKVPRHIIPYPIVDLVGELAWVAKSDYYAEYTWEYVGSRIDLNLGGSYLHESVIELASELALLCKALKRPTKKHLMSYLNRQLWFVSYFSSSDGPALLGEAASLVRRDRRALNGRESDDGHDRLSSDPSRDFFGAPSTRE
jgi:hypothetical protein